jgi:hypothetical protein
LVVEMIRTNDDRLMKDVVVGYTECVKELLELRSNPNSVSILAVNL